MSDLMEWLMILFVAYSFCCVWIIGNTLDSILKILSEIERKNQ